MRKILGIALLAAGVILLVLGWNASESAASEITEVFEGTPTDRSIWMIVGGIVLAIVGAGTLLVSGRTRTA